MDDVVGDTSRLTHLQGHRPVALPAFGFEELKIGAGPPPLQIPEGWLLVHHGVTRKLLPGVDHQPPVSYAAGAMILSAGDPSVVLVRTSEPLLRAELALERTGIVPNVVFPTAIEEIDGRPSVFYGMDGSSSSTAWPTPHRRRGPRPHPGAVMRRDKSGRLVGPGAEVRVTGTPTES